MLPHDAIDAVIFDMDGLLLDTEIVYERAMMAAAAEIGFDLPMRFCRSMIGVPAAECDVLISDFFGAGFPLAAFNQAVRAQVVVGFSAGIPVKPGAVELLQHLEASGRPKAVATSTRRPTAENHLKRAGLLHRFPVLVTRTDVARGKPHPDLFLKAAAELGVAPERCLALEDSLHGIAAAHAAGTLPVMVPDLVQPTEAVRRLCVAVAADLHAVRVLLS